jgi:hypothetical protein
LESLFEHLLLATGKIFFIRGFGCLIGWSCTLITNGKIAFGLMLKWGEGNF